MFLRCLRFCAWHILQILTLAGVIRIILNMSPWIEIYILLH